MATISPVATRRTAESAGPAPSRTRRRGGHRLVPLVGIVVLVIVAQIATTAFSIPVYIFPAPTDVFGALISNYPLVMTHMWPTIFEAVMGFLLGNSVAILLAVTFMYWRSAERMVMPMAIIAHTIPVVAIAPVLVIMMGSGFTSKIAVAALVCFFPTLVNMVKGLRSADRQSIELMQVLSASKTETLTNIRAYACLPFLFSALKIAAGSAFIGAIIAEWIGSQQGLGYLIIQTTYSYDTPLLYVVMLAASILSISLFSIVATAECLIVRWKPAEDS